MLLTNANVEKQASQAGLSSGESPFEFGLCYAETLKRWRSTFLQAYNEKRLPQIDKKFLNLWRLYLSYCEGAFMAQRINVGHFSLVKP
jgi:cyclopropane-fatty-acyl-phospholipid synthase